MLPIVWFYIALVVVSWIALLYVELRLRARRRIRGAPELIAISKEDLDSLAVREPDLIEIDLIEESAPLESSSDPIAHPSVKVSGLRDLLARNRGRVIAFCAKPGAKIDWERVGDVLFALRLKKAFVLETCIAPLPDPASLGVPPTLHTNGATRS